MLRVDVIQNRASIDSYYQKIIKPAAKDAGLAALRSDEVYGTKPIVKDIWNKIWAARVVIADVTDRNPNVNYELGLCDALGVPAIIIAADVRDLPFDYTHRRCILYNRNDPGWDDKLRLDLAETIRVTLAQKNDDELEWPYDTDFARDSASGLLLASADSRSIVIRGAKLCARRYRLCLWPLRHFRRDLPGVWPRNAFAPRN